MTNKQQIGFIGAGNMNSAIIGGLLRADFVPEQLMVSDPNSDKLDNLNQQSGIGISRDNIDVATFSDVLIIGVKPHYVEAVCQEIATMIGQTVIVSVAAGIQVKQITGQIGSNHPVVRVMPNTPCLVQSGAIGLYANQFVNLEQRNLIASIFETTGLIEWIDDETQMDLVTALSGSGPAYFFYFAEAMIAAGESLGMSKEQATQLVYQTMTGAARMLQTSDKSAADLRIAVTSPGGTTAAALASMQNDKVDEAIGKAIKDAYIRGQELSRGN